MNDQSLSSYLSNPRHEHDIELLEITGILDSPPRDDAHSSAQFERQFFYFPPESEDDAIVEELDLGSGLPRRPPVSVVCMMGFCPCFTNDPCSEDKVNEYKHVPKTIVFLLTIIQLAVFIVSLGYDGFAPLRENWLIGPTGETLIIFGAKYGPIIRENYEFWRLITPMFLHSGCIDLCLHLFYQIRIGLYLEPRWGWARFIFIYITCGAAGATFSCLVHPDEIVVTASTSFLGVMAAYFAQLHVTFQKYEGWQKKMNFCVCIIICMSLFVLGAGPNFVDASAQFSSVVMGLVMGYGFFAREYTLKENKEGIAKLIPILALIYMIGFFFVAICIFFLVNTPSNNIVV